jgi:toxin ParE1/3/4
MTSANCARSLPLKVQLRQSGYRGRKGRVPKTRELVIARTPFVVAYRINDKTIEVLRVFHGSRRWPDRL